MKRFLSEMLLIFKTWKELNYNSYLWHKILYLLMSIFNLAVNNEPDIFSSKEEVPISIQLAQFF